MRYSRRARRRERCSRTRPNKEPAALCVCTWRPACSFSLAIKSALALHCVTFSLLGCASHTLCPRRASHNLIINPHVATAADSAAIYILLISAWIWAAVKYATYQARCVRMLFATLVSRNLKISHRSHSCDIDLAVWANIRFGCCAVSRWILTPFKRRPYRLIVRHLWPCANLGATRHSRIWSQPRSFGELFIKYIVKKCVGSYESMLCFWK